MTRRSTPLDKLDRLVGSLVEGGREADPDFFESYLILACAVRESGGNDAVDQLLLGYLDSAVRKFGQLKQVHEELGELVERITATPWHTARFLRLMDAEGGPRALLVIAGALHLLAVAPDVEAAALATGDLVFLNGERSLVVGRCDDGGVTNGETAVFESMTDDGRLIVSCRDESLVVSAGGKLDASALKAGQRVRWDRSCWMALEHLSGEAADLFISDDVPDIGADQIGGLHEAYESLLAAVSSRVLSPELLKAYGIDGRRSILLHGCPGGGKTLMCKVVTSRIQALSGRKCAFAVVRPSEFESSYVGETQARIRGCFQRLRELARERIVILVLDEVDSLGRIRGNHNAHHSDSFLMAFMAELDGFVSRGEITVISTTNRKDSLDPALLERLAEVDIAVPRPDAAAAREILGIHLPERLRFADGDQGKRHEIIETVISRLYSAGDSEAVAKVQFRDASSRTVCARELMSGRTLAQLCLRVSESAMLREASGGPPGILRSDAHLAVDEVFAKLRTTLTLHNIHAHIRDMPQDLDVVRVEPVVRKADRAHRYLRVAS